VAAENEKRLFTSSTRKTLFLELASSTNGTIPSEVHRRAKQLGDTVTEEAYYNLARRLVHRGLLVSTETEAGTRYKQGAKADGRWLEEDDLSALVDPDYPLLALTVWDESRRLINDVPESLWSELRERLKGESARDLFHRAIVSYCDDFRAQIADLDEIGRNPTPELAALRREAENSRQLLLRFVKYGLGISDEAVHLPLSLDIAIPELKSAPNHAYVNEDLLREELRRRISDEPFIVDIEETRSNGSLLVGAVDGSTRGGVLSFLGDEGDFGIGHAPMIAINTAVGQVNRSLQTGTRFTPVFLRLPEKPEDMQRQDNRFTVMAKLLYPDLSDAQYMHSVWNAMDLLEAKASLRLLHRWDGPKRRIEVPPSDIVLRDGTVTPQDRDFNHYADMSTYGRIVREMIAINWEIARKCRDDGQTLAGVVKAAQLSVFAPVVNWFACQAMRESGQILAWPILTMNLVPDQVILTRLVTAERKKTDGWTRTCIVQRPFHSVTNYARTYSRTATPAQRLIQDYREALEHPENLGQEKRLFWESNFRPESDEYLKLLENVYYASFFMGAVPRLDIEKTLPRLEFVVCAATAEDGADPWPVVSRHRDRLIEALRQVGFEVSAEHTMFQNKAKIDVLPRPLIRVHDTVKIWASELLSRTQEFVGYYLARYVKTKRFRGVRVRPFSKAELELLYSQLKQERELRAGRYVDQTKGLSEGLATDESDEPPELDASY
jgi:hypothetical protein